MDLEGGQSTAKKPYTRRAWSTSKQLLVVIFLLGVIFTISDIEITTHLRSAFTPDVTGSDDSGLSTTLPLKKNEKSSKQPLITGWTSTIDPNVFYRISQQTSIQRGIVVPLFDGIGKLGIALLMSLRAMNIDLMIEVPHCGDFSPEHQKILREHVQNFRLYDVCALAAKEKIAPDKEEKVFCNDLDDCHDKFRSFFLKILSVVYSEFKELMIIDADVHFFQNPAGLWDTDKYQQTGTLMFNDRIVWDRLYLAERKRGREDVGSIHDYLAQFDISIYSHFPTIPRKENKLPSVSPIPLPFQPSDILVSSHAWSLKTGHLVDSSVLLWNKDKQQRATAILTSMISQNGVHRPLSYGDKEYFMYALELAETQYEFSDYGCGAAGVDVQRNDTVLCGDAAHYWPVKPENGDPEYEPPLLYMNSNSINVWNPATMMLYHTKSRPREFYPGKFEDRHLDQSCPFDITIMQMTEPELATLTQRQAFHKSIGGKPT